MLSMLGFLGFVGILFSMLISSYIGMRAGVEVMNNNEGECHKYAYNVVLMEAITFILMACVLGTFIVHMTSKAIT